MVVQEALETTFMSVVYLSRFTPQTNIGVSSLEGPERTTTCAPASRCACAFSVVRKAPAFEDVLNAHLAPGQLRRVAVADHRDALAVYGDGAVVILDGAVKAAMYGVVFYGVCKLRGSFVGSVYGDDLYIVGNDARSERQTADASETIDCNFDHFIFLHLFN